MLFVSVKMNTSGHACMELVQFLCCLEHRHNLSQQSVQAQRRSVLEVNGNAVSTSTPFCFYQVICIPVPSHF